MIIGKILAVILAHSWLLCAYACDDDILYSTQNTVTIFGEKHVTVGSEQKTVPTILTDSYDFQTMTSLSYTFAILPPGTYRKDGRTESQAYYEELSQTFPLSKASQLKQELNLFALINEPTPARSPTRTPPPYSPTLMWSDPEMGESWVMRIHEIMPKLTNLTLNNFHFAPDVSSRLPDSIDCLTVNLSEIDQHISNSSHTSNGFERSLRILSNICPTNLTTLRIFFDQQSDSIRTEPKFKLGNKRLQRSLKTVIVRTNHFTNYHYDMLNAALEGTEVSAIRINGINYPITFQADHTTTFPAEPIDSFTVPLTTLDLDAISASTSSDSIHALTPPAHSISPISDKYLPSEESAEPAPSRLGRLSGRVAPEGITIKKNSSGCCIIL